MQIALRVFKERTEGGALVHRIRSKSAKETCDQLVKIARSELGAEADRILGL